MPATPRKTALSARAKSALPTPRALWAAEVSAHLEAVLKALREAALGGNITAIKLILEAEGLTEPGGMESADALSRIVALCTVPIGEVTCTESRR